MEICKMYELDLKFLINYIVLLNIFEQNQKGFCDTLQKCMYWI